MRIIIHCILLCCATLCFGQRHSNQIKPFSELYITPHLGMSWQSTLFKPVLDFSGVYEFNLTPDPYDYEKNVQGFGIDVGFTLSTKISRQLKGGVKTNGRLRYDLLYGGFGNEFSQEDFAKPHKGFLFDFSNTFLLTYNTQRSPERDVTFEVGFTINQMGKSTMFSLLNTTQRVRFYYQYTSVNFGLGYDIIKLNEKFYVNTALFMNYIPRDFPGSKYPEHSFMTLGLKAAIKFKRGKIRLSHKDYFEEPKMLRRKNNQL